MQMSVALANSGDVQLELIQPRNDAPSMYKDFLDCRTRRDATHRLLVQRLPDPPRQALAAGYLIGQEGSIGGEQGRFAYLDTEAEQGTVIEISDISGPKASSSDTSATSPLAGTAATRSAARE